MLVKFKLFLWVRVLSALSQLILFLNYVTPTNSLPFWQCYDCTPRGSFMVVRSYLNQLYPIGTHQLPIVSCRVFMRVAKSDGSIGVSGRCSLSTALSGGE